MFPFGFEGRILIGDGASKRRDKILSHMKRALDEVHATSISQIGNTITFRGGVLRPVSNWNVLVPISSGQIELSANEPQTLHYKFTCGELLLVATFLAVVLGFGMPSRHWLPERIVVPMAAWFMLFAGNYFIAMVRLPRFIRKVIDASDA